MSELGKTDWLAALYKHYTQELARSSSVFERLHLVLAQSRKASKAPHITFRFFSSQTILDRIVLAACLSVRTCIYLCLSIAYLMCL